MKYFILLLISTSLWAHENVQDKPCIVPIPSVVSTDDFKELKDQLEWWGASTEQVKNAPCKAKSVPLDSEMKALLSNKSAGSKKSESVFGVRFNQESPALIQAFKDLTTRRSVYGGQWIPADDKQIQVQQEYSINPACDKVVCAVEKIWGAKLGAKILHLYLKHGFNASELAFDSADRFKEEEIDDVLMAADDLPAHFQPLGSKKNQRLVPFSQGYTLQGYDSSVLANSGIILFDSWRKKDSLTRQYTTFHELAHNISDRVADADSSSSWLALSGWKKLGDKWEASGEACMISKYGETNPFEDFAEISTAYRYNAAALEEKCPAKYSYMKDKIFKGVEYKNASQCMALSPDRIAKGKENLTKALIADGLELSVDREKIEKSCGAQFSKYPLEENEILSCSLKLAVNQLPADKIGQALKEAGIADSALNREMLLSQWGSDLKNDSVLVDKLNSLRPSIEKEVDRMVLDSQLRAAPKNEQLPSKDHVTWYVAKKKCGPLSAESSNVMAQCLKEHIIDEDESRQSWGGGYFSKYSPPSIFKEEALAELKESNKKFKIDYLGELDTMKLVSKNAQDEFKKELKTFAQYVEYQSKKALPADWQNMGPEDFCSQTYGTGNVFVSSWGLDKKPIPMFQASCVAAQKKLKQRGFLPEAETNAWIEALSP